VISTFNTCLRGPTHRSLTDIGEGYNLGGVDLPHHTLHPSQTTILRFPPKGPAQSQVNQSNKFHLTKREQTLILMSGTLQLTSTISYHLSIALLMVSHKDIRLTRINQKVDLNETTVPHNPYKLNAQSRIEHGAKIQK
jgi:hypothetical protein